MFGVQIRRLALAVILFFAVVPFAPLALAEKEVVFVVEVQSVFGRSGPGLAETTRLASLFRGQTFTITGRTTDSTWVRVDLGGWPGEVWVLADYGTIRGDLSSVPAVAEAQGAPSAGGAITSAPPPSTGGTLLPPTKVTITITLPGVFVRNGPSRDTTAFASAFKGQAFAIRARDLDATWVQIDFAGAPGEAWVWVYAGTVKGDLESVPVVGQPPAAPSSASAPADGPANPLGFSASALDKARNVYRHGLSLGGNSRTFSRVGDSNSETTGFLSDFDGGVYDLGDYGYLQSAVNHFAGSFRRMGAAVQGFTTWGLIDPLYSDPRLCRSDESALACELRLQRPSVVLVMLGANDVWVQGAISSEPYLRHIVQTIMDHGAVPVLSTFAWNPSSSYYASALRVNETIRKVAADLNAPLWDFYQSAQALPAQGIGEYAWDPHAHLSDQPGGKAYVFREPYLQAGMTRHNLEALQALYTIWRNAMTQ